MQSLYPPFNFQKYFSTCLRGGGGEGEGESWIHLNSCITDDSVSCNYIP